MSCRLGAWFLAFGWVLQTAWAHVGSPFIVFEGKAGTIPVRIVVRQPAVVPGLADISIRILTGTAEEVRVLPLHWRTDRSGAPPSDRATLVTGETNLYTAALWLMSRGAYAIEVQIKGLGGGTAVIPVNSVAYDRKPMPQFLGIILSTLGVGLVVGVIGIAIAAAREATLPAGVRPGRNQRLRAVVTGILASIVVSSLLYGASEWWNQEDRVHVSQVLYRQSTHTVETQVRGNETVLKLVLTDPRQKDSQNRLIPDHGKLVHLFLVEAGISNRPPAFAHLHPRKVEENVFSSTLPNLPAGLYRVFTELAHEGGFTQTLTNSIRLPVARSQFEPSDPDDSSAVVPLESAQPVLIGDGIKIDFTVDPAPVGEVSLLHAKVTQTDGSPARLESYLRMLGHTVVMREDGSVFSHVHPAGNLSLAATRTFARKLDGEAGVRAADANCGDLEAVPPEVAASLGRNGEVSFPFVFPQPGRYFVWIQVKVNGQIRTALFATEVKSSR